MLANIDPRRQEFSFGTWTDEPATEALARTPSFGRRFFDALFEQFPKLAAQGYFLRSSSWPDDVYGVFCSSECEVGVQIDAELEYICVWNADDSAEFGDWGADQVPPAIDFFRALVHGKE